MTSSMINYEPLMTASIINNYELQILYTILNSISANCNGTSARLEMNELMIDLFPVWDHV